MNEPRGMVPYEGLQSRILVIRGQKVLLDTDLAALYGVSTKAFNQAIKRNETRFPKDFMFRLSAEEATAMRSQFVTASRRNIRYLPVAFTEHGAIMAATILNSPRAVEASVWVVRAFVKFREALAGQRVLLKKILELESKVGEHDGELKVVLTALKQLMARPVKKKRKIGFGVNEKKGRYHAKASGVRS